MEGDQNQYIVSFTVRIHILRIEKLCAKYVDQLRCYLLFDMCWRAKQKDYRNNQSEHLVLGLLLGRPAPVDLRLNRHVRNLSEIQTACVSPLNVLNLALPHQLHSLVRHPRATLQAPLQLIRL